MKVFIVGLAVLTAWLISTTIKNRNKIAYLRNQVAQVKKMIIKLETAYGKEKENKESKREGDYTR